MTRLLYREDAYRRECEAVVAHTGPGTLVVDATVFYARAGGQPGDTGILSADGVGDMRIADTFYDRQTGDIIHRLDSDADPGLAPGAVVRLAVDWSRRHLIMRTHTSLHLLCAAVDAPVTGGNLREGGTGRIDFDLPEVPDRGVIAARLDEWVANDISVDERAVDEKELDHNPALVRTVAVRPPRGIGEVRLVEIAGVDLQACGGTHVRSTGEIGRIGIAGMSKKGRSNRRIEIGVEDA